MPPHFGGGGIIASLVIGRHENRAIGLCESKRISQGRVATRLRCGGIFSDDFITSLLLTVKVCKNPPAFGAVVGEIKQ